MSSWDTNLSDNFCDPYWELICCNKWHAGISENIHTTQNSCRDTLPCTNIPLKLPQYFYLLMEKSLGHYFQVWSSYCQLAQYNQKTNGFCPPPPPPSPPPMIMRGDLISKFAKILWGQNFFLHLWGDKPLWGELKLYGGVIVVTTLSSFHLFRNSQHPEK